MHTKTDLTDEAGRPILDGTVFWKALDTSMHIGSGDTAELTLYVPAPVVRAHDNQRAPGLKGWNIIHVNQTGWMQIPEHSQHIMISDMTGRVCLSVNTTNLLRNEIKVSDLSVGIYIVRINTTASIISRSITVSR